jgi:hypothetical protein
MVEMHNVGLAFKAKSRVKSQGADSRESFAYGDEALRSVEQVKQLAMWKWHVRTCVQEWGGEAGPCNARVSVLVVYAARARL